jgi:hypothetical protein
VPVGSAPLTIAKRPSGRMSYAVPMLPLPAYYSARPPRQLAND